MCLQLAISAASWAYSRAHHSREQRLDQNVEMAATPSQQKALVIKVLSSDKADALYE